MAVNQKLSEVGWFYHAPAPVRNTEPIQVPIASQIPGLNDLSSIPYDEVPRSMFRDTDTKYIRLAKMGGREDLLRFREPKPKNENPVAYPRNDWFYLEDNRMEELNEVQNKPWEFRLPEYMVHDEHRPFGNDYDYQNDPDGIVYWKKGRVAPGSKEIKRYTRNGVEQPMSAPASVPSKAKAAATANQHADSRYPPVPQMYSTDGRPAMNKLLAYGYANEWEAARDDWYNELRMMEGEAAIAAASQSHKQRTQQQSKSNNMTWNDIMKSRTQPVNAAKRVTSQTNSNFNKQPFKLSKFEKVGAKINSHRPLPPIVPH